MWWCGLILLFSGAVQGASGFGMALMAVPLLCSLLSPQVVVPAITLAGVVVSALTVFRYRVHCDWRRAAWLGVPALICSPLGVHLLRVLTAAELRVAVGAVLLGNFAFQFWLRRRRARLGAAVGNGGKDRVWVALGVGGVSGVLGGALAMTGPLLADYLVRTPIRKEEFKITLNLIFLASALWRTVLYLVQGVGGAGLLELGLLAVFATAAGSLLGERLARFFSQEAFLGMVQVFLALVGGWMVYQGLAW